MNYDQTSHQGSLYELVARGVKDTYFIRDDNTSRFPYHAQYDSSAPHIAEKRSFVPLNAPKFGETMEIELETYGDILTHVELTVDLPTWLPTLPVIKGDGQQVNPKTVNDLYWIRGAAGTDSSGVSYGYTNGVGYFLFEKIELYQDQFCLQSWSGDGLFATSLKNGSWNSSFLEQQYYGLDKGDAVNIARRATPARLRLKLPVVGCSGKMDTGLPLFAFPLQKLRLRIKLRKLEDLVEDSIGSIKPQPWNVSEFSYLDENGDSVVFSPIGRNTIGQPNVTLTTMQEYILPETKQLMASKMFHIPFMRMFENVFSFGEMDYIGLDSGGTATVTRRLDGRHPSESIVFFFRSKEVEDKNQLWNLTNEYIGSVDGEYYNQMKLVIAGQDREYEYGPTVWTDLENHCKDGRDTGRKIGEMNWGLGSLWERREPRIKSPEGTVNFTTADRPTFHIMLQNIPSNPADGQRRAFMRCFVMGWGVYEVANGRGRILFTN